VNAKKTEKDKYDLSSLGKTGYVAGGPDKWIEGANAMIQQK
jgi:hypothetical protein